MVVVGLANVRTRAGLNRRCWVARPPPCWACCANGVALADARAAALGPYCPGAAHAASVVALKHSGDAKASRTGDEPNEHYRLRRSDSEMVYLPFQRSIMANRGVVDLGEVSTCRANCKVKTMQGVGAKT